MADYVHTSACTKSHDFLSDESPGLNNQSQKSFSWETGSESNVLQCSLFAY